MTRSGWKFSPPNRQLTKTGATINCLTCWKSSTSSHRASPQQLSSSLTLWPCSRASTQSRRRRKNIPTKFTWQLPSWSTKRTVSEIYAKQLKFKQLFFDDRWKTWRALRSLFQLFGAIGARRGDSNLCQKRPGLPSTEGHIATNHSHWTG